MTVSLGKYISQKLRSKGILNKEAAKYIGLSKSAFEKILGQSDIYPSRLVKLSTLLEENLFEYYNDIEPIKAFRQKEVEGWQLQVNSLSEKLTEKEKRLLDQEDIIRLLKEKEQFLTSRS
ncbi:MAG: hypothetical protein V4594_20200 [Bacteroidota bacterium]